MQTTAVLIPQDKFLRFFNQILTWQCELKKLATIKYNVIVCSPEQLHQETINSKVQGFEVWS